MKDFFIAVGKVALGIILFIALAISALLIIFGFVQAGNEHQGLYLLLSAVGIILVSVFGVLLYELVFG